MTKTETITYLLSVIEGMEDDSSPVPLALEQRKRIYKLRLQYFPFSPGCNPDPRAVHDFDRSSSLSEDRYVCSCEYWEPEEDNETFD